MKDSEKQEYLEHYKAQKEKGVPFYPDILYKDAVISLVIFLILIALTYFLGAPLEEQANPSDTTYTPRPEWYFLFLFQLLKYFPGSLEVIGVVLLPTIAIILLFLLPLLDRSPLRHYRNRILVVGVTLAIMAGIFVLTGSSIQETPPPVEAAQGDPTAALYATNCAACHGPTISVGAGTNLHNVIAQGKHEGMPAWSADLTSDQIDSLAGFILSPGGSQIFNEQCGQCHDVTDLVEQNPIELKNALEKGKEYEPHKDVEIPKWNEVMSQDERTKLLNFLVAPDGQRLYAINCSPCHGTAVGFTGDETQLRSLISEGGMHLDMPAWKEKLEPSDLETLSNFVVNPGSSAGGAELFREHCASCHGARIPIVEDVAQAREIIASGGPHQTMPVWGQVLTPEQLDALTAYTLGLAEGTPIELGQELFSQNCSVCHGELGEGGPNPTRSGDIIAPISTAEFLKTRDDFTLKAVISQGQPNFGMAPFETSFGGPLDTDQIDAIVAFMRSWEANPPVELPPEIAAATEVPLSAEEIFTTICAQCHGERGEGAVGPSLSSPAFQSSNSDQEIFDSINLGHPATAMIGWGDVLTADQIEQLVGFIRQLAQQEPEATPEEEPETTPAAASFSADVMPIFKDKCAMCHGSLGGWDASSYETVMTSGDNAPVVVPGDPDESLLAQKLLGTQTQGTIMPPGGKLSESEIQIILDWIAAGALDN
jgi:mono/diheme cytochrome c family protein